MGAKRLPGPVVPRSAHGVGEERVGCGPHRKALVREDDLSVNAVAGVVAQPFLRCPSSSIAFLIFAFEDDVAITDLAEAVADLNRRAVGFFLERWKPIDICLVYTFVPQV